MPLSTTVIWKRTRWLHSTFLSSATPVMVMLLFSLMKVVLNFKWFNGWVRSLKHKYSLNFSKLPQPQVTGVGFFWTIEEGNSEQSFHCCKEMPFCCDVCVGGFLKINSKFCKILLVRESILSLDSQSPCPRKMKNPASPCFLWGFFIPSWWFCHLSVYLYWTVWKCLWYICWFPSFLHCCFHDFSDLFGFGTKS